MGSGAGSGRGPGGTATVVVGNGVGARGAEDAGEGELLVAGLLVLELGGTTRSGGSVLVVHPRRTIALSSDTAVAVERVR